MLRLIGPLDMLGNFLESFLIMISLFQAIAVVKALITLNNVRLKKIKSQYIKGSYKDFRRLVSKFAHNRGFKIAFDLMCN